jgi:hypothetical protein
MMGGYYKRYRAIARQIDSGAIDLLDSGILDYLCLKANLLIGSGYELPAGVVSTSAPALRARCKWVSVRTIQRRVKKLEKLGFLKTPPGWKNGTRGNRPVVLCRVSIHDMSGNEFRVNCEKTEDWRNPMYEPVAELSMSCPHSVAEVSGLREVTRQKRGERRTAAAKRAPLPDPRHKLVFDSCFELYRERFRAPPTWGGREGKTLQRFLRQHAGVSPGEIARRYEHQLASTGRYHAEKHGSLLHLLSNFDAFADGPVLGLPKGGTNEKSVKSQFDPVATAEALGFRKQGPVD